MIRFACRCGHQFEEPDNTVGMAVPCPDCLLLNDVPVPFAKAAVLYQTPGALRARSFAQVLLDLVQPLNLLVFFFVLLVHLLMLMLIAGLAMGLFIVVPVAAAVGIVILGHFANVIDEIGVNARDELPRLMRDLGLYEDILWPFARTMTALVLAYGLAVGALFLPMPMPMASSLAVLLAMAGTYFFPAILLTLQTSGSLANLRPDRILGMTRLIRKRYAVTVLFFALALLPYAFSILWLSSKVIEVNPFGLRVPALPGNGWIGLATLCIGIFMMHAFCWELGLIYRLEGERFPWVGRFHVRGQKKIVIRRRPTYVAK